jgi:hypothetical protein
MWGGKTKGLSMSLSAFHMRRAAAKSALQAARRLRINDAVALRTAPVAIGIILYALRRNSVSLLGPAGLRYALRHCQEDVLKDSRRLGAADVRARGEAIFYKVMGRHADRAVAAVAKLAKTDAKRAKLFLAICAAAVASALSETKRELNLSNNQTLGVLISEAAMMDNADPSLIRNVRDWVFQPPFLIRFLRKLVPAPQAPAATVSA